MAVGVCLCVCPRAYLRNHTSELSPNLLCVLCVAVHRSSTGGVGRSNYDDVTPLVLISSVQLVRYERDSTSIDGFKGGQGSHSPELIPKQVPGEAVW